MKSRIFLVILATVSVLAAEAPGGDLRLDLEALWPNTDGNHWEFEQTYQLADGMPNGPDTVTSMVGLRFDGTTTAFGGGEVQNLVEESFLSGAPRSRLGTNDAFARTLWEVRPDLRAALGGAYSLDASEPFEFQGEWAALLVHGGAFERTSEEIVTWRTSQIMAKSWMFLVADLTQGGDMFQLQLVPDLAPDVFLTGTQAGFENVSVPAGQFENCLRVDYVIDYGTSACTTPDSPDALGSFRAETAGSVYYAPGVGPVRSEETLRYHDVTGGCGVIADEVAQRVILELSTAAVPAQPATWGQMKTRFRQ